MSIFNARTAGRTMPTPARKIAKARARAVVLTTISLGLGGAIAAPTSAAKSGTIAVYKGAYTSKAICDSQGQQLRARKAFGHVLVRSNQRRLEALPDLFT
jgi:hypothetical protein